MSCPPLESMGKYAVAVIDPPWPIWWRETEPETKAGYQTMAYDTMSLNEIAALPIPAILEPDAWVFLWCTQKMLPHAFAILEGWGLTYRYTMGWHKSHGPKPVTGPIYNLEFVLVGSRGAPKYRETTGFRLCESWFYIQHGDSHSAKPEEFYDLLRRVTCNPRIDVFNRRKISGFTGWGHEAPAGEPDPDHWQEVLV